MFMTRILFTIQTGLLSWPAFSVHLFISFLNFLITHLPMFLERESIQCTDHRVHFEYKLLLSLSVQYEICVCAFFCAFRINFIIGRNSAHDSMLLSTHSMRFNHLIWYSLFRCEIIIKLKPTERVEFVSQLNRVSIFILAIKSPWNENKTLTNTDGSSGGPL